MQVFARAPYLSSTISSPPVTSPIPWLAPKCIFLSILPCVLSSRSLCQLPMGCFHWLNTSQLCPPLPLAFLPLPLWVPLLLSPELPLRLDCCLRSHCLLVFDPWTCLVHLLLLNMLESHAFLCRHAHHSSPAFYPCWFSWLESFREDVIAEAWHWCCEYESDYSLLRNPSDTIYFRTQFKLLV